MDKFDEFAKMISIKRAELNITLKAAAKRIGISNVYLNGIETGRFKPSMKVVFRISKALNLDTEEIMKLFGED